MPAPAVAVTGSAASFPQIVAYQGTFFSFFHYFFFSFSFLFLDSILTTILACLDHYLAVGNGIQIRFDFAKAPGNESMTAINATIVTNQPSVTGFQMQVAVPNVRSMFYHKMSCTPNCCRSNWVGLVYSYADATGIRHFNATQYLSGD
eukprot:COSAG05_NODE_125_length_17331_cov_16.188058_13_plen_148_part_00